MRRCEVLLAILVAGLLTAPAFAQLAAVPGGRGAGEPTASPPYQTRTYLFKLAPQGARSMRATGNANWEADWAAATGANGQVVNLIADSLALDLVQRRYTSSGSPANWQPGADQDSVAASHAYGNYSVTQSHTDGSWPNRGSSTSSRTQFVLLWFPIEQYIPQGWTVEEAFIRLESDGASGATGNAADTLCVVAMAPGDSAWYKGKITEAAQKVVQRCASFNNQVQPATFADSSNANRYNRAANGYPRQERFTEGTLDSMPWDPPLTERLRSIDYGPRSRGTTPITTFADGDAISIDAKRPLQKMLSGEIANNGLLLALITGYASNNGSGAFNFSNYEDAMSATADSASAPYVVVTVSNKRYDGGPWAGKEIGFSFVADGGYGNADRTWTALFEQYDWRLTLAPPMNVIGTGSYVTYDELIDYLGRGHEVGWQTRWWTAGGLSGQSPSDAEALWAHNTTEGYNGIKHKLNPAAMDSAFAANDNAGREQAFFAAHPKLCVSIACPNNAIGAVAGLDVADSLGYVALRTTYSSAGIGTSPTPGDTAGANVGSTIVSKRAYGMDVPRKFNALVVPARHTDVSIFGNATSPNANEASVKRIVRLCIEDAAVRGNELWCLYSHDTTLRDSGPSGGITAQQMAWLLEQLAENGNVRVAPLCDNVRLLRRNLDGPYDHPAWGGTGWQDRLDGLHYKAR